jgi:hypothetical protein
MIAFGAPEEPHFAFISSAELAEPPDSKIVCTLGTLYLDSRHGLHFFFFIVYNPDFPFFPEYLVFHIVSIFNLPDIAAFLAFQLTPGRY